MSIQGGVRIYVFFFFFGLLRISLKIELKMLREGKLVQEFENRRRKVWNDWEVSDCVDMLQKKLSTVKESALK